MFRFLYQLLLSPLCGHTWTGLPEGIEDRRSKTEGEYREIKAMLIFRFGFAINGERAAAKIANSPICTEVLKSQSITSSRFVLIPLSPRPSQQFPVWSAMQPVSAR
jgi:hypothetical protein